MNISGLPVFSFFMNFVFRRMPVVAGIFDKLTEWLEDGLAKVVEGNLNEMNNILNNALSGAKSDFAQTTAAFDVKTWTLVKSINKDVVVPVAGVILTAVLCVSLIKLVIDRNNMHDVDTFKYYTFVVRGFIGALLITNAFDFVENAYLVGSRMVIKASAVAGSTSLGQIDAAGIAATLKGQGVWKLLGFIPAMWIVNLVLSVVMLLPIFAVYSRLIEMYFYLSVSALPFSTLGDPTFGDVGKGYIKNVVALSLQAVMMFVCFIVYTSLVQNFAVGSMGAGDIIAGLWKVVLLSIIYVLMLFKCGSIARNILGSG